MEIGETSNCVVSNEESEKTEKFVGTSNLKDPCNETANPASCVCVGNNGKNLSRSLHEKSCAATEKKTPLNIEDSSLATSPNVKVSKED